MDEFLRWPWFGMHRESGKYPAHGYIRTRNWHLHATEDTESATRLLFGVEDTTGPGFDGTTKLALEILIGERLTVTLTTTNTGALPCKLSCALHTYFAVSEITRTRLQGLQGTYSDKTRNWAMMPTPDPYSFTEETDRIHLFAAPTVSILDDAGPTHIHSHGHDSIVVWNPWDENARKLPDMADSDFKRMLCVETALTQDFVLAPKAVHSLTQTIE